MLTHFFLSLISKISLGIVGSLLLSLFNFQGSVLPPSREGARLYYHNNALLSTLFFTFFKLFLKNFLPCVFINKRVLYIVDKPYIAHNNRDGFPIPTIIISNLSQIIQRLTFSQTRLIHLC